MVETVSQQSQFNFSSDYTPYSFASTMRTCYANNKTPSIISSASDESNSSAFSGISMNSSSFTEQASSLPRPNLESRRSSCNEMYLRNSDQHHNCNNKRCSNTITTTCVNSNVPTNVKPKLQLTTTTFEDTKNNCLSSCTTQLQTPQSNGMISQKHQFNFDQQLGQQQPNRMSTSGVKQKRSESLGLYRQNSELNDNNNNLISSSFDDNQDNSNSSEDDFVFNELLSSSPSMYNPKSPRQLGTFVYCKKCGSNSSLTSFSSISSISSANNQFTLTNNKTCPQSHDLINNLSHSLNQTFNFGNNNLSTPQYGRSRHNSINSLTLCNTGQPDRNLHALHKALHNIFSN